MNNLFILLSMSILFQIKGVSYSFQNIRTGTISQASIIFLPNKLLHIVETPSANQKIISEMDFLQKEVNCVIIKDDVLVLPTIEMPDKYLLSNIIGKCVHISPVDNHEAKLFKDEYAVRKLKLADAQNEHLAYVTFIELDYESTSAYNWLANDDERLSGVPIEIETYKHQWTFDHFISTNAEVTELLFIDETKQVLSKSEFDMLLQIEMGMTYDILEQNLKKLIRN